MEIIFVFIFSSSFFRPDMEIDLQVYHYESVLKQYDYMICLHQNYVSMYEIHKKFSNNLNLWHIEKKELPKFNAEISDDLDYYIKEFSESVLFFSKQKYDLSDYLIKLKSIRKKVTQKEYKKIYERYIETKRIGAIFTIEDLIHN